MSFHAPCHNGEGCWTGSLAEIYGSGLEQDIELTCQNVTDVTFSTKFILLFVLSGKHNVINYKEEL